MATSPVSTLTPPSLDSALFDLSTALSSLPHSLSPALDPLPQLLSTLAYDVKPASDSLSRVQLATRLQNSTFVAEQLTGSLQALIGTIPESDVKAASRGTLLAMIETGTTQYTIMTLWAPEVWAILLMFLFAFACKLLCAVMVRPRAVERARIASVGHGKDTVMLDREMARMKLAKPAKAMIGHVMNLLVSTFVLCLQLAAYRMFALPSQPMRFLDVRLVLVSIKLLSVAYAVDLSFGDVNPEIIFHHIFTFSLYLAGQICAYKTNSPKFFRLANWLTLQATLEQPTYLAMVCYHAATFLRLQGSKEQLQRTLLKWCYRSLVLTKWITYPQKIAPAILALYWLGRMWNDIDHVSEGRFWIGWCLTLLVTLLLLQIKFCDDVWPLTAHVRAKLYPPSTDGPTLSRTGPVMTILLKRFSQGRERGGGARGGTRLTTHQLDSPTDSSTIDFKHFSQFSASTTPSLTKSPFVSTYVLNGGLTTKVRRASSARGELPIAMMFVNQSPEKKREEQDSSDVTNGSSEVSTVAGDVERGDETFTRTRTMSLQRSLSEVVKPSSSAAQLVAPRPTRSRSSMSSTSVRRTEGSVISVAHSEAQTTTPVSGSIRGDDVASVLSEPVSEQVENSIKVEAVADGQVQDDDDAVSFDGHDEMDAAAESLSESTRETKGE
ncbi:hypothetical protein ACM66B_006313 [Microbotryomycetes sp. NB124-2]